MSIQKLLRLDKTEGKFGVEIELEGDDLVNINAPRGWRLTGDGSLSDGGIECVLRKPCNKEKTINLIHNMYEAINNQGAIIVDRQRAGVHIHVNCQEYTSNQIYTFATAYLLLEDLLMEWCGDMRKGNHFCFSGSDAEGLILRLRQAAVNKNLHHLNTDELRYASLNMCSLFRYGSLEFRGMRSCNEPDPICQWVEMLDELEESAKQFENPQQIIESASGYGDEVFLERLMPSFKEELMKLQSYGDGCVRASARRLQLLAYSIDWHAPLEPAYQNPFAPPQQNNVW